MTAWAEWSEWIGGVNLVLVLFVWRNLTATLNALGKRVSEISDRLARLEGRIEGWQDRSLGRPVPRAAE